jgi:hypothetical protein
VIQISLRTLHKGLAGFAFVAALLATSGRPTIAQDTPPTAAPDMCVRGFSKFVDGQLAGPWTSGGCGTLCRTAQSEAALTWSMRSNPSTCETGATCDESPGLEGRIRGKLKVNVRSQRPCPYRGAYEGTVEFTDATGAVVASGRIQSTLGVGTHQKACVGPICTPTAARCETCYDVNFAQNSWRIGTEGTIDAAVTAGRYRGCRIRASLQGDFQTGWGGPFSTPWSSRGNLDGVLECPCFVTQ